MVAAAITKRIGLAADKAPEEAMDFANSVAGDGVRDANRASWRRRTPSRPGISK